jgi:hypothetical protein
MWPKKGVCPHIESINNSTIYVNNEKRGKQLHNNKVSGPRFEPGTTARQSKVLKSKPRAKPLRRMDRYPTSPGGLRGCSQP